MVPAHGQGLVRTCLTHFATTGLRRDTGWLIVSARLAEHRVPGIVAPVRTRDGRVWSQRAGRQLSIVPWVSDHRALYAEMREGHWIAFGALLARVHATTLTGESVGVLPREEHDHTRTVSTVRSLTIGLRRLGEETVAADDHLIRALTQLWFTAASSVAVLSEHADRLGQLLCVLSRLARVTCHGDPHLGNILLGPGDRVWLIDWDDARMRFASSRVCCHRPACSPAP